MCGCVGGMCGCVGGMCSCAGGMYSCTGGVWLNRLVCVVIGVVVCACVEGRGCMCHDVYVYMHVKLLFARLYLHGRLLLSSW